MTKTEQTRLQAWRFKVLQQAAEGSRNVARTCRHFGNAALHAALRLWSTG